MCKQNQKGRKKKIKSHSQDWQLLKTTIMEIQEGNHEDAIVANKLSQGSQNGKSAQTINDGAAPLRLSNFWVEPRI